MLTLISFDEESPLQEVAFFIAPGLAYVCQECLIKQSTHGTCSMQHTAGRHSHAIIPSNALPSPQPSTRKSETYQIRLVSNFKSTSFETINSHLIHAIDMLST